MYKIVYNACYGGFNLSDLAICRLKELGYKHEIIVYLLDRHDPVLVQVIIELGEKANGDCSKLKIHETLHNFYRISYFDGFEEVITTNDPENRVDWICITEES